MIFLPTQQNSKLLHCNPHKEQDIKIFQTHSCNDNSFHIKKWKSLIGSDLLSGYFSNLQHFYNYWSIYILNKFLWRSKRFTKLLSNLGRILLFQFYDSVRSTHSSTNLSTVVLLSHFSLDSYIWYAPVCLIEITTCEWCSTNSSANFLSDGLNFHSELFIFFLFEICADFRFHQRDDTFNWFAVDTRFALDAIIQHSY